MFHFQDLIDGCNNAMNISVVFRIYFPVEFFWFSSKFKLLSMSKTMLFILPVFNAIYIPKQQLTVPSSSILKLCQTFFFITKMWSCRYRVWDSEQGKAIAQVYSWSMGLFSVNFVSAFHQSYGGIEKTCFSSLHITFNLFNLI